MTVQIQQQADTPVRRVGTTTDGLPRRLHHYFEASVDRDPAALAVVDGPRELSYREVEQWANRLAHLLEHRGVPPGARVGILLHRSSLSYVALLGVLKRGAAFVPLDPACPADRVAFIAENAGLDLLLTTSDLTDATTGVKPAVWCLDRLGPLLADQSPLRPRIEENHDADPLCYIIYTSGSSGRPKGVAVGQSSICNFVAVASSVYEVRAQDRVYQGMSLSFDFSVEEIWPTFAVGATVIVGPADSRRLGAELADFLEESRVTVLYCVPTLLATIPRDLTRVRSIMVGGEACHDSLVERWSRPGRRMLNTYGPTEATVTATWTELVAGRPVTIGRAMPTYSVVLLNEQLRPVPDGQVGEICIGGPGVALGYVGLPERTADRFVEHPLAPRHGGREGRLYRTGDLGYVDAEGEIVYLGRADGEVKVRGHRVDLGEIENVLLESGDVEGAVAALVGSGSGEELAAYVVLRDTDARSTPDDEILGRLHQLLVQRLPDYMVPSYLDPVTAFPLMTSGKVDRRALPAPVRRARRWASGEVVLPTTELEEQLSTTWARALGVPPKELSVDADFFTDLGGHSLSAATVVSDLREGGGERSVTMRDLYTHRTIRSLAAALDGARAHPGTPPQRTVRPRHRSRRVATAGLAQGLVMYASVFLGAVPLALVADAHDGQPSLRMFAQLSIVGLATLVVVRWLLVPIVVRLLATGVTPGRYFLWGKTHRRLWLLDGFLALSPLALLSGSPLLPAYLRLLGAHVGPRCHVGSSQISLPTLISVGAGSSIGYGVSLRPWTVEDGWIVVGRIRVGKGSFVGASSVLEPGTHIGDGAAVARHSAMHRGRPIGDGERWAGSPAAPVATLDPLVEGMAAGPELADWPWRHRLACAAWVVALELLVPLVVIVPVAALVWAAYLAGGLYNGLSAAAAAGPLYVLLVCLSIALLRVVVLPQTPTGVHSACSQLGIRKWVSDHLLAASLAYTNTLYATLYTVAWLRLLGAEVGRDAEVSTAAHLDPDLLVLHEESFIADMASVGSAEFCNGRMAFQPTHVGRRAFVGNASVIPAGTSMGPGSLVGVHTVPPPNGVPAGTSWLGSPAMFLPCRQDSGTFDAALTFRPTRIRRAERLAIELIRITLPASLLAVASFLCVLGILAVAATVDALGTALLIPLLVLSAGIGVVLAVVLLKWCLVGRYRPRVEPLWGRFVRRTELVTGLYEAAAVPALLGALAGTPFLAPLLRLFGARIGRRTWIATTYLTEFDLVNIADDATVGRNVSLQTHLFEDRVMKMSRVRIGASASVGDRAIVLYDAAVGDAAELGALSLLMKGEHLPRETRWRGIPAQVVA